MVQAIDDARRRMAGRVPPHNLEAEESLLGAMLLSRDAITAAVEAHVEASDFYKPAHGAHLRRGHGRCTARASPSTRSPSPRSCAAPSCSTPSAAAPRCCASRPRRRHRRTPATTPSIVNELALLRRLIGVAGDIAEMGYDDADDVAETLDRAESMVFEVAERRVSDSLVGISDSLQTTLDQLESIYGSDTEVVGVPTGYHELDELLLGLQRSNLVIVAARPSMGKCVAWDTPIVDASTGAVQTAPGGLRTRAGGPPGRVLALDDDLRVRSIAPSAFVDDGVKPVYKITTRTGRVVRTTITHPFLTADGWKPLADICVGDRVAVPRSIGVFGDEPRARSGGRHARVPHRERLSRRRLADDEHAGRPRCSWSCSGAPPSSVSRSGTPRRPSTASAPRWGGRARSPRCCASTGSGRRSRGPSTSPMRCTACPASSWRCSSTGSSPPMAGRSVHKGGQASIGFSSRSERLARGVQHLLLRFGVASQLRHRTALYNGRGFPSWQIEVSHAESIRRFAADIGILGKEDAVARVLVALERRSRNSNLDTIPAVVLGRGPQGQGRSHVAVRLGGGGEAGQLQLARRHTLTAAGNARTACRGARLPRPRAPREVGHLVGRDRLDRLRR